MPRTTRQEPAEPEWKQNFRSCQTRISFELKLTRPMLEFLCACSDDVWWDRSRYGNIYYPDNFLATEHALERRGLIERAGLGTYNPELKETQQRPVRLTPVGKAVVEMLKIGGLFLEAEEAREKIRKRVGRN